MPPSPTPPIPETGDDALGGELQVIWELEPGALAGVWCSRRHKLKDTLQEIGEVGAHESESMTDTHDTTLARFGFATNIGSAHQARSYMLDELQALLEYVPAPDAGRAQYQAAIVDDNCLGKRSVQTRKLTARHLKDLYGLDPAIPLFRTLRYFWSRDGEGQPLLALLCACARDSLLRQTAPFILKLPVGAQVPRSDMEAYLTQTFPDRLSKASLKSAAQNVLTTWTRAGHLRGHTNKMRARAAATPGAAAYALYLSAILGGRGELLFQSPYAALLDCPTNQAVELADTAAKRGWIVLKHIGEVIEVEFPPLLTEQERAWLRE